MPSSSLPSSVANLLGTTGTGVSSSSSNNNNNNTTPSTNHTPKNKSKKGKKSSKNRSNNNSSAKNGSSSSSNNSFASFSLSQQIQNALSNCNFKKPTPIQQKAIPLMQTGRDCLLMSRTGSGKTLAFVLPLLDKLRSHSQEIGVRGLIISPTRELALQIFRVTRNLLSKMESNLRVSALLGGDSMDSQFTELAKNPDIIVATPGRLVHMMDLVKSFSLQKVQFLCFDEADRLFELGFKMQVEEIIKNIPKSQQRQVVLVSATLPRALAEFAQAGLQDPATVRLDVEQKLPPDLKLCYLTAKSHERWAVFLHAIRELIPHEDSTLIFVATRHHAEFLHQFMRKIGFDPAIIYGKMDFDARKAELQAFERGIKNYLIVTDVAARGIDIPLLNNVINVHFPAQPKLFLHRVGRAARAGRRGVALSIVTPEEMPYMLELLKFLDKPLISLEGSIDLSNDSGSARLKDVDEDESMSDDDEAQDGTATGGKKKSKSTSLVSKRLEEIFQSENDYEAILNQFDGYFGSVPPSTLQTELDYIVKEMTSDVSLKNQFQTGVRAYRLYKKTRATPSNASLKRARDIFNSNTDMPVHPLCAKRMGSKEEAEDYQKALEFTRSVSNYKPNATVFELVNNSKEFHMMKRLRKNKAFQNRFKSSADKKWEEDDSAAAAVSSTTQQSKPQTLAEKLLAKSSKTAPADFTSSDFGSKYRDEKFFMSYEPEQTDNKERDDDRHYQINELTNMNQHVFGMVGEDQEDIMRDRRQLVWDKKKRKYVHRHLLAGQRLNVNKKIKNEAGVVVNRKDTKTDNTYAKWRQKTGARIQGVGESEESFNLPTSRLMTRKARIQVAQEKNKQRKEKESMLKKLNISESHYQHREAKKQNELKNTGQMVKEHKQKAKDEYTEKILSRVRVLGKRKVTDELAMEGQIKKARKIHKQQKHYSDKRKLQRLKNRESRMTRGKQGKR